GRPHVKLCRAAAACGNGALPNGAEKGSTSGLWRVDGQRRGGERLRSRIPRKAQGQMVGGRASQRLLSAPETASPAKDRAVRLPRQVDRPEPVRHGHPERQGPSSGIHTRLLPGFIRPPLRHADVCPRGAGRNEPKEGSMAYRKSSATLSS